MQNNSEAIHTVWLSKATLVLAIITRLIAYLYNRSLFLDEAVLARNLFEKDWQGLLGVLDYNQSAPVGFLLTSKFFVSIFGHSEYALRLFPLLMAIAACILLYKVGLQIQPRIVPLLMLWFATSNINLRYATEFKQYSSDLMFTLLLLLIAHHVLNHRQIKNVIFWTVASVVAVWFSHPSVFVIAGFGISLIFILLRDKDWRILIAFAIGCMIAMVSFFIVYFNFYQYTASGTDLANSMQAYWANDFFQLNLIWLIRFPFLIFQFIAEFKNPILLVIIIFGFIIGLRQLNIKTIALLLMPVLFTLIASNLTLYPLRNRFLLFLLPEFAIIIMVGLLDVDDKLHVLGQWLHWGIRLIIIVLFVWTINLFHFTMDVRGMLKSIDSISVETPILYLPVRIGRITYYYDYPYQTLETDTTIEDIRNQPQPIWVLIPDGNSTYAIIEEFASEPTIQTDGINAFCIDGYEESCPE